MRFVWSAFLAALSALVLPSVSFAQQTNALETLKQNYTKSVDKMEADHESTIKRLNDAYSDALDKAIVTLKQQGDPDPVKAAVGESLRFQTEKTVPNPPSTNLPSAIQDIQRRYIAAVKNSEIAKARKFLDFAKPYVTSLDSLMKAYTMKDQLDFASAAKKEKEETVALAATVEMQMKEMLGSLAAETPQQNSAQADSPPKTQVLSPVRKPVLRSTGAAPSKRIGSSLDSIQPLNPPVSPVRKP